MPYLSSSGCVGGCRVEWMRVKDHGHDRESVDVTEASIVRVDGAHDALADFAQLA